MSRANGRGSVAVDTASVVAGDTYDAMDMALWRTGPSWTTLRNFGWEAAIEPMKIGCLSGCPLFTTGSKNHRVTLIRSRGKKCSRERWRLDESEVVEGLSLSGQAPQDRRGAGRLVSQLLRGHPDPDERPVSSGHPEGLHHS